MDKHTDEQCKYVFRGNLVHSTSLSAMEIMMDKIIGVSHTGKILFVEDAELHQESLHLLYRFTSSDIIFLKPRQFLMPGLIDTHIHAPQYAVTGTGYGQEVVEWLKTYIHPIEAKFKDLAFARNVSRKAVERLLKNGTTAASYFGTIHCDSTIALCDIIAELGQRAHVGIVNLDCSVEYGKSTECCINDTERFIKHATDMKNPLLTPVVTPRGIARCSKTLLTQLGEMAKAHDIPVQVHLREIPDELGPWESVWAHSKKSNLAKIFEDCGLVTNKAYFSHCIYLSEEEIDVLALHGAGIAHCPGSNFDLKSGIADVRHMLDRKLKVGLGTDVSGGHSPSMLDAIRQCITATNVKAFSKPNSYKPLSYKEAFFLATLGGSEVLGLSDRIGNFEAGKEFDALLIDVDAEDSPIDTFECDTFEDVVQKFIYLGDDRNILEVYVAGRPVAGRTLLPYLLGNREIDLQLYT